MKLKSKSWMQTRIQLYNREDGKGFRSTLFLSIPLTLNKSNSMIK